MVDSLATVALETLRDLLIDEGKLLLSVGGEVEEFEAQLKTIHCFLQDVDRRQDNSKTVLNCVKELRRLSIEAESVLETYDVEVTSKREGKDLKSKLKRFTCILGECVSMHETGTQIGRIRSRMEKLTKEAESLTKGQGSSSHADDDAQWSSRRTYGDEFEEHFVGMEKNIKVLESLVKSDDDRSKQVISICGMGGLGKTTLANKIYNLESVKDCFEARAWICVSQKFQCKSIFQGLLKQLLPEGEKGKVMDMDTDELVRKLKFFQREKKCLMVLDDIWEVDDWESLRCAFPIGEIRCKVLLTTRNERIAETENVYKLECLSEDDGWKLLQKIALPINYSQELHPNELELLEKIGREMVRKCGYLPLSISVIGGTLRQEKSRSKWEKVSNNIGIYLKYHGEGVTENKKVKQVLDLSYSVLPYKLKPCFLYLGCFSEDEEIDTRDLYLLWMSEGMISSEDRQGKETLRDVAERYLSELANRCMVQVSKDEYSIHNRFESCRLHDLIRDLCLSKGKEEGFVEVLDKNHMVRHKKASSVSRLAIHPNIEVEDCQLNEFKNLRSLLFIRKDDELPDWDINLISINFGIFKSLKILRLENFLFENGLPNGIENLILLKHFSIEQSTVAELPASICKLPCLQSLNLKVFGAIKLPNSIHKIRRLRHLYLYGFHASVIGGGKLRFEGLNELETLWGFESSIINTADVIKLPKLRVLHGRIYDEESLSMIVDCILNRQDQFQETSFTIDVDCDMINSEVDAGSKCLLSRTLMCHSLTRLEITCRLNKLPSYEHQLGRNLLRLRLSSCYIMEDPMEMLEKLPMLQNLSVTSDAFVGREMVCRANGFPRLNRLVLMYLPNLVEWRVEEKAMPNLSDLYIESCKKLEMIPEGLRFIHTLKDLFIQYMPGEFTKRLRVVDGQAGEDYHKFKHIPSITIIDYK